MYRIIGADQKEYGPALADQVRKWIVEGRADARTRARSEGGGDWKSLSDFPEFAAALADRKPGARPGPPRIGAVEADRLAADIIARDYRVDIGECFSRSWNLVKDNFGLIGGATATALIIGLAAGSVPVLGIPAAVLLAFVLQGGLHWLFLKRLRGQPAQFSELFAGFSRAFVPLLLAGIFVHLLVAIGVILLVLPGIYLVVAWRMFVPLLIMDKGLGFWPAMELSRKVVTHHWWQCFALFIAGWLVGLSGSLACIVGIFFTLPIAVGAIVCAYEQIFATGAPSDRLPAPTLAQSAPTSEAPVPPAPTPTPPVDGDLNSPAPGPLAEAAPESVPPSGG